MKVLLEFPDIPLFMGLNQEYVRKAFVSMLYNIGKISEKEACFVLGLTRRAFEDLLPEFGFSILSDSQENIDIELRA